MRTLLLATILFMASLTGCQSLEAMLSPKPEAPQIALDPIYQDLMPIVGSYYALGTTTFLPLSPEDYAKVQAHQEPDDSAAISGFSPELAALSAALRHSGASSCTSSAHCQGLKPTYITTTMLSPADAAYVLVELKTPELTLQRLYERASLTPLSALSIQASRAPLYDLSLLQKQSLTPHALSPEALEQAPTKAQTRTKHHKVTSKPKSSSKTKASPKPKYEPTPKGKTIAILTANKAASTKVAPTKAAAPQSTAPKTSTTKAAASTAAHQAPAPQGSPTPHGKPAPHGALTQAMNQRAQELGVPSESERRKLQAEALRRADAAFINLQRMAPQGSLGSSQLQGTLGATLGSVSPNTGSTLNTIQGAATNATNSMRNLGSGENKLPTALNAARVLSSSSQRVLGALSEPQATQPGKASVSKNGDSAVFASGPFKPTED